MDAEDILDDLEIKSYSVIFMDHFQEVLDIKGGINGIRKGLKEYGTKGFFKKLKNDCPDLDQPVYELIVVYTTRYHKKNK